MAFGAFVELTCLESRPGELYPRTSLSGQYFGMEEVFAVFCREEILFETADIVRVETPIVTPFPLRLRALVDNLLEALASWRPEGICNRMDSFDNLDKVDCHHISSFSHRMVCMLGGSERDPLHMRYIAVQVDMPINMSKVINKKPIQTLQGVSVSL